MNVVRSVPEMRAQADGIRRGGHRLGLVPTMGYLHEGHLALVRESIRRCEFTLVSIFVNPTQFGPHEDFSTYPRDIERDCRLCEQAGADSVFIPPVDEMYAPDRSVTVEEDSLSRGLCGASRPGHFRGVCTVVAKLFNIVRPDVAVFGQKDAQQLAVIRRLTRDLNFPIEIVGVPIVREADGLAMSSRNVHLSPDERGQATGLNRVLRHAEQAIRDGMRDAVLLREDMDAFLGRDYPGVRVEYIAFVDADTLEPRTTVTGATLIALAARVGETRLIDNTVVQGRG